MPVYTPVYMPVPVLMLVPMPLSPMPLSPLLSNDFFNMSPAMEACRSIRGQDETHGLCLIKSVSGFTFQTCDAARRGHVVAIALCTSKTAVDWISATNDLNDFLDRMASKPLLMVSKLVPVCMPVYMPIYMPLYMPMYTPMHVLMPVMLLPLSPFNSKPLA
jgi:hypothetical protein